MTQTAAECCQCYSHQYSHIIYRCTGTNQSKLSSNCDKVITVSTDSASAYYDTDAGGTMLDQQPYDTMKQTLATRCQTNNRTETLQGQCKDFSTQCRRSPHGIIPTTFVPSRQAPSTSLRPHKSYRNLLQLGQQCFTSCQACTPQPATPKHNGYARLNLRQC